MEFQPKVVLITGACGFIASNVLNYLCSKYKDITFINVDRLDYCSSLKNITVSKNSNYYMYTCDITNSKTISNILHIRNVDTVLHFAAQTHVDNSFGNSIQFTIDNVLGTHTLLECCREYGKIKRFVHVSTDEVYGEVALDGDECQETTILKPTNPYAATKASAEHLVFSYYHSFKLPIIITRGNNVYGRHQYPEKLIPKCITSIKENKAFTIHGEGKTVRNFIHVDDVSTAIETILFKGRVGEIYNIGSKNEFSVMEIVKKIVKYMKNTDEIQPYIKYIDDRLFNDLRYSVSNNKLVALGWNEMQEFESGLQATIEWYLNCSETHWLEPK
jgi:dTDP-glucose 4,6-dehydratase